MLTYRERIREYERNPTLCFYCHAPLPYSDLRPLSALITKTPEICSSDECCEKFQQSWKKGYLNT